MSSVSFLILFRFRVAPLRSSDRRKLRQRVIDTFSLQPEEGDNIVPDGLRSAKFRTHLDEHGVRGFTSFCLHHRLKQYSQIVYLSQDGDPLWFTAGKGSEELIPTGTPRLHPSLRETFLTLRSHLVYTLWKHRSLLPILTTPARVIPILAGGADLMAPGGTSIAGPAIHHLLSDTLDREAKSYSTHLP